MSLTLFNFQGPLSLPSFCSLSATYLSYHTFKRLSRVFFKLFLNLFSAGGYQSSPHPLRNPLFMRVLLISCRSLVRQLSYNTIFPFVCQHLFSNFFLFLQIVYFTLCLPLFPIGFYLQFVFFGCFWLSEHIKLRVSGKTLKKLVRNSCVVIFCTILFGAGNSFPLVYL